MKTLPRRGGRRLLYLLVVVVLLGSYGYWALARPWPPLNPTIYTNRLQGQTTGKDTLTWPAAGQAAVGIVDSPILETHGNQTAAPIASTAKVITALVVLHTKPLKVGQQGPSITLGANDVDLYNTYAGREGSVVKVQAGEQISEYQLLQTILLPSANNMADSLAIWAFGSLSGYTNAANSYLKQLGLRSTHVGSDASGFAPNTTSTAGDLVRIGKLAMQNPVLAQIVSQPSASDIPVVNNVKNVNFLLGSNGIIGVKTGNTDQAGGVFISAARTTINKKPVVIVTALVGSPTLFQAMKDSLTLSRSAQANFSPVSVVRAGTVVGNYKLPWGGNVTAVASKDLMVNAWSGSPLQPEISLTSIPVNSRSGQTVGSVIVPTSALSTRLSVPVKLKATPTTPSTWWRLLHP